MQAFNAATSVLGLRGHFIEKKWSPDQKASYVTAYKKIWSDDSFVTVINLVLQQKSENLGPTHDFWIHAAASEAPYESQDFQSHRARLLLAHHHHKGGAIV